MSPRLSLNLTLLVALPLAASWHCGGSTAPGGADASSDSRGGSSSGGSSSTSSGGSSSGSSTGGSSGSGSSSSGSGGGNCPTCNSPGYLCCNGVSCSVDSFNDPTHCGGCSVQCTGSAPFCAQGHCTATPCSGQSCTTSQSCCGDQCCNAGQICCEMDGPVDAIECFTPTETQPTCPAGCTACVSDRNLKRDIVQVDPDAVLDGVARLPIATWSYKSDDPSVRHMGAMAQDFHAEFGLGDTDKAYNPVDAHGVEMAAIQALYARVLEQQVQIERLERACPAR